MYSRNGREHGLRTNATKKTGARYWAIPGTEGFMHIASADLEKSNETGAISTEPENHNKMTHLRQPKVDKIATDPRCRSGRRQDDAELLIVGWGGTYGHLHVCYGRYARTGKKVAFAHFQVHQSAAQEYGRGMKKYKKVVVAEQNMGQFAGYLRMKVDGFDP